MTLAPDTFAGLAGPEIDLFRLHLADYVGCGVEIGCLDGFSSAVILDAAPGLHLTSIDPFIPDSMESSLIGHEERYRANVAPYPGRSLLIKSYAQLETSRFADGALNFLFIDGDHNYHAVIQDLRLWTPKLKQNSLLAIHDSRMGRPGGANFHPGPSQAAAEVIYGQPERWRIVGEAFSLTLARKLK